MENIRILENEKIARNMETNTLVADYENDEIIILLETISDGLQNDNYFLYTVLDKTCNGYAIIDEIELENEVDGYTCNNDLTNVDIEKELKEIATRFSSIKC